MRKKPSNKKNISGLSALLIALVCVLGLSPAISSAAPGDIDLFSTDQVQLVDPSPADGGLSSSIGIGDATILGGSRDISAELLTESPFNPNADAKIGVAGGAMSFSVSSLATGIGTLQWDGPDGDIALDPVGLGGVDLTGNGFVTEFEVVTLFSDLGHTFVLTAWSDADHWTSISLVAPAVAFGSPETSFIQFSDFTNCAAANVTCAPGGAVDVSTLGALQLEITSAGSVDMQLDSITTTVPPLASLGDRVWNDLNADGDQDCTTPSGTAKETIIGNGDDGCSEPGIPGVNVALLSDCGTANEAVVDTRVTDAAGFYLFDNLQPGSYCVEFDKTSAGVELNCSSIIGGVEASPQNVGADTLDSDASPLTGQTGNIVLNAGDNDLSNDAGFYCPAKIGDMLINDLDRDGIQDPGEPGVDGETVTLFKCENNVPGDQVGLPIATDGGMYMFNPLPPGDYAVQFTAPDGFVFSDKAQGNDPAVDCDTDANGLTDCVTLAANEYNDTVDACVYEPVLAGLGNFVWEDLNADGIQNPGEPGIPNIPVTLKTAGNDNLCETGDEAEVTVATTSTDAAGMYLFTGLDGGNYCITFDKSQVACDFGTAAFSPADVGSNDTVDSDANTSTGETGIIVLPDGVTDLSWDAGIYCPAKIGDFVWLDTDRDGIQDTGENGIPGVTVKLLDCNGNEVATPVITDADGMYMFSPLMPGDYNVMFTAPAGLVFSPANAGGDPTVDSDADATGMAACTDLVSNEYDPTWDAGLNEPANPDIDIEKATNGVDADDPNANDAPQVAAGELVTWSYKVTNTGNVDLINVSVTDDQIGAITCPESTLAIGAMMTCTADGIADDLMNTAFTTVLGTCGGVPNTPLYENKGKATGESVDGTIVQDVDPSHYCNPPEECGECVGKVTQLTLMYNGSSDAHIEVTQKDKKATKTIFSGTVLAGGSFSFNGMDRRGTMGPEIKVYVNGELHTTIHTSCSQPIGPGLVSGDFTVLSGYSLDGGLLCPLDDVPPPPPPGDCECSGKVTELTLSYLGPLPTVDVEVKQRKNKTVFSGTVIPGEHFSFSGVDKNDTLGTEIEIFVNGSSNTMIHTSCSQPIGPGLISGDFQVEMGYSRGGMLCPLP